MPRSSLFVTLAIGLALTAGCASKITSKVCTEGAACTSAGISYSLPQRMAKLVVDRAKIDPEKARAAVAAASGAVDTAKKTSDEAQASAARKKAIAEAAEEPARTPALLVAAQAAAEAKVAREELSAAQGKLATAQENLRLAQEGAEFVDKIEISLLPMMGDPDRTFVADLDHQPNVDDDVTITTSEDGLLQSSDATHTDRTGDIVVELAKTAAGVAKLTAGFTAPTVKTFAIMKEGAEEEPKGKPFHYEAVFDPSNESAQVTLKTELSGFTAGVGDYDVDITPLGTATTTLQAATSPDDQTYDGLVYRRPIPYLIELSTNTGGQARASQIAVVASVPNRGTEVVVPVEGRSFTKATNGVSFKDGMLIKRKVEAPSEAFGVAQIPPRILKEIASLPTDLIQLKIDTTSKQTELLQAQKLQLDALKALVDAETAPSATPTTGQ